MRSNEILADLKLRAISYVLIFPLTVQRHSRELNKVLIAKNFLSEDHVTVQFITFKQRLRKA